MRNLQRQLAWPAHDGEMAELIRTHDWARSQLGPMRRWSKGLKTLVELLLAQQMPTALLWGPNLVQIYNDSCRELLGDDHPRVLGSPAREPGSHVWHYDPELYERALKGETVGLNDTQLTVHRKGTVEKAWFALCYTPARSADSGNVGIFVTAFDTTARIRREAARAERERTYQLLFNSINDGFCILEAVRREDTSNDYRFIAINPAFAAQTGQSNVIDRTVTEVFSNEPQEWTRTCDAVLRTGTATRFERKLVDQSRFVEMYAFPVDDPSHGRVAMIFHDITTRKRAELALRESEARLSAILQHVPVGVGLFDTEGRYILVNPLLKPLVGDVIPSKDTAMRWRSFDRSGRELERHEYPGARALRGETVPPEIDCLTEVDDEERWIRVGAVPLFRDGEVVGGISVALDMTDYKRADDALRSAERRLRALVEGIPQLVWRAADGGHWRWSSPQWTRFTGLSEEASHGLGWLEAVHPDDQSGALAAWRHATETHVFEADYRLRRASDGRYRWFQGRASPVRNEDGSIIEWLGTSTDVDDLRQLQESQKIMVAELQHRTRNLIMVVQSIAQQTLQASDSLDGFAVRFRGRLSALSRVQGLLSRSDAERISIGALIRMELDALGAGELAGRVQVDGPNVPLQNSIVQTLALAIHELATNARKYGALASDNGQLAVTWRVHTAGDDPPHLALEWTEKGLAVPPAADQPQRRGYGRELIEHALPYALGAQTQYELDPMGVRCAIHIPLDRNALREIQ